MPASREDRAKKRERHKVIEQMMSVGMSKASIAKDISEKTGVTERTVRKDILKIEASWAEEAEAEGLGPLRRNQTRQLLRAIVRAAMKDRKYNAAISGVNRLMELDGLKQAMKIEHSGTVEHRDAKDELADILDGIAARQRAGEVASEPH